MTQRSYLEYHDGWYFCTLCQRWFNSETAYYSHCRYTSHHEWCERCSRVFRTTAAKEAHLESSSSHNICYRCADEEPDFDTYAELKRHLQESHHYCPPCEAYFRSAAALQQHDVLEHFLCIECGDFFDNANNLRMHKQTHDPRNFVCYGYNCDRMFKSFSGMLIHLESGNCDSGATKHDIGEIARDFYDSSEYMDMNDDDTPYFCPSCESFFGKLSALYQHVEDVLECESDVLKSLERSIECRI
ncbi:hypothetical protein BJX68DRAFT_145900 [Aspergillus pseudodeflectus]|uniref:C2H2-type domain-containing protein n=1 Tax=Aspergillus pseudodeflectus TaxID=176178 RepID=A0ABR4L3K6_9EURO